VRYRFLLLDVFTDRPFGGNQLAVFPEAEGLNARQMQQITREFNFSECVFAFPPETKGHACRLRIFTPGEELPFAGHPTVGAAFALASIGRIPLGGTETRAVLEEGVGPLEMRIHSLDGKPVNAQFTAAMLPQFGPPPPANSVLASLLSIDENDLLAGEYSPEAVTCGVPFLYIPLRSIEAVRRARLDMGVWEQHLASYWAPQPYLFSFQTETQEAQIHARMFAPGLGVKEDPATGAAATALGGYLGRRSKMADGTQSWLIEQGFEIGRPSFIRMEIDKHGGQVSAVRVGGAAVVVGEGSMEIPG
jgi:trans-2,3-dihydro-3-hydroxyanthranilate isomerase